MRVPLRVAQALREAIPDEMPLFVRISATDWVDGGWDLEQSIVFSRALKRLGIDLIDCSSGAIVPGVKIPVAPGYQVPFAAAIRERSEIMTGAVGMITEAHKSDQIIRSGAADLAIVGRELLRRPYWALEAAEQLGTEPPWPVPYGYAVKRPGAR